MRKNLLKSYFVFTTLIMIASSLSSCSSGDGDGGNGGGDWFVDRLITSFPITYETDGYYKDYVIEHLDELFSSDGRYGGYINLPSGMLTHGPAYYKDEIDGKPCEIYLSDKTTDRNIMIAIPLKNENKLVGGLTFDVDCEINKQDYPDNKKTYLIGETQNEVIEICKTLNDIGSNIVSAYFSER